MDNEKELQVIFRELNLENQVYLLLEARRFRNAETAEQDPQPAQWEQTTAPAVRMQ